MVLIDLSFVVTAGGTQLSLNPGSQLNQTENPNPVNTA